MLTGAFRRREGEKVDIIDLSRKNSTPGSSIPETVVQSQIECVLIRKAEDSQSAPVTSKNTSYRCYLFEGEAPDVSQIIKRSNDERLTILTDPEEYKHMIYFDCLHTA